MPAWSTQAAMGKRSLVHFLLNDYQLFVRYDLYSYLLQGAGLRLPVSSQRLAVQHYDACLVR